MQWQAQRVRPITRADVGRFVVGFGCAGYAAGWVEEMRSGLLVIDTGGAGGPLNGNVVVEIIEEYTFLEAPNGK